MSRAKLLLQLRNLALFLYALPFVVFVNRRNAPQEPRNILIVQFAKLGDMVCTTPVFRAIKKQYPNAKVFVVGDGVNQKILAGNPDVDTYVVADEKNILQTARRLRAQRFDFGFTLGPTFVPLLVLIFSGAKSIATYKVTGGKANQTRTFKILQRFTITVPYRFGEYLSRTHLRLLEPIGILSDDTRKHLYFTGAAEQTVQKLFAERGIGAGRFIVGMSPSAGHRVKEWPAERFAEVANHVSKRYNAVVLLVGGPNDAHLAERFMARLDPKVECLNTVARLSIDELKAAVSHLSLFISVDTGPIYIAEAFDVPTIDIAGPIDVNEQPPRGRLNRTVVPKGMKEILLFAMNVRDYRLEEVRAQVESITVPEVVAVVDELVGQIGVSGYDTSVHESGPTRGDQRTPGNR